MTQEHKTQRTDASVKNTETGTQSTDASDTAAKWFSSSECQSLVGSRC